MIYLDNNATTFVDPAVLTAMLPLLQEPLGNPSSIHFYGQQAKGIYQEALKKIALKMGVQTDEIVFTSGATEALNMLIRGSPKGKHILSSSLEHPATLESLKVSGCRVTFLDPKPGQGAISPAQVEAAIRPDTALLVFMAANNETGIQTDLEGLGSLALRYNIPLVVDGVAWLGKEVFTWPPGVAAMCFSGHKIHAPVGIGFAIIKKTFRCNPFIVGGPQQHLLRGGTEPLALIVGLVKALELLKEEDFTRMRRLRDRFEEKVCHHIPGALIHGYDQKRVSNTSNIAFPGLEGDILLMQLDRNKVAASHGSACSTGTLQLSRVLLNMDLPANQVRSSIRFSLSRLTKEEEIEEAISRLVHVSNVLMFRNLIPKREASSTVSIK